MNPTTHEILFEDLQRTFCPPLDPALIAAFLHEVHFDNNGTAVEPTEAEIRDLRTTLSELSLQADDVQNSESSEMLLAFQHDNVASSSWTTPSFVGDDFNSGNLQNNSSTSSAPTDHPFDSPLGFLQTALPEIPISRLRLALDGHDGDELDLFDVIATLLSEEAIRDMEERGVDGLDEDNESVGILAEAVDWEIVKNKKAKTKASVKKPQTHLRPKKIALSDVRQQHRIQTPTRKGKEKSGHSQLTPVSTAVNDPWTQVSSLSSQLSTLLPPCPPTTFSSFFHSPKYSNSYDAARAAISSFCKPSSDDQLSEAQTANLFHLLDIVMPAYEDLDLEQRSRVISDIELAVSVAEGRPDAALDLVNLLRDLDTDVNLGLVHNPPTPVTPSKTSSPWKAGSSSSSDTQPSTPLRRSTHSRPQSASKPSPYEWTDVPLRPKPRGPNPHAEFIPAYARSSHVSTGRTHGANESRMRLRKAMEKRNQALISAAAMWQSGNTSNRGGEVALYYAERARELQAVAKVEALNAARELVLSSRKTQDHCDIIDLHGTKVAEAIIIVKEILHDLSLGKSLKIITGKGKHSVGQVSVLKPAVKNALESEGWNISTFEGGLVVRHS